MFQFVKADTKGGKVDTKAGGKPGTGYSPELVIALNEAVQTLPVTDARIPEVATELNQFFAAAVPNRRRLDFDCEPSSFTAALRRAAKEDG